MSEAIDISKVDDIHQERESYNIKNKETSSNTSKNSMDELPVNKNMLISEVIEQYPELLDVFLENGLHCVGCAFSPFDTIEIGCKTHGWEDEQIDEFVAKLNDVLVSPEKQDSCCGGGCGCGHNKGCC